MKDLNLVGKHVHFIGIGGSGLSSIAVLLKERGVFVSGSDMQTSLITQKLLGVGLDIKAGHRPENITGADLVVRSSAVKENNVEVQAALAAGIPVLKRETFMPYLIGNRDTIAIAGTHGKTTTTTLIAWLLHELDLDPSYIIGGNSPDLGGSAHAGKDNIFVIEADEYDRMFLGLTPKIAVVTNVEHDHPDCYPTELDYRQAFADFIERLDDDGVLLACEDNPGSRMLIETAQNFGHLTSSYSINKDTADYFADDIKTNDIGGCSFSLNVKGRKVVDEVQLQIPGKHNVSNALAALGVVDILGLSLEAAARHCPGFSGSDRRFEIKGEPNQILLIDDYAHHPTEIRATLAAARLRYPNRRIWVVWQPHTYSRTRTLLNDYLTAFDEADRLIVTEIYAAREQKPADDFSGRNVVEFLIKNSSEPNQSIVFEPELSETASFLRSSLITGDVLLVLSAGNADWINSYLLEELSKK